MGLQFIGEFKDGFTSARRAVDPIEITLVFLTEDDSVLDFRKFRNMINKKMKITIEDV